MRIRSPKHRTRRRVRGRRSFATVPGYRGPTIPAKRWKRWLWYVSPRRFGDFWFTKQGGITAAKIAASGLGVFAIVMAGLFLYFAKDLPTPGQINSRVLAQTTQFYDRTGQHLLYEVHGDENRTVIDIKDISPYMQHATVAIEDRNFYHHGAFSSLSIIRAAINNVLHRGGIQGGSTITQQYVKNALLSPERTFTRKIKELILSIQIEQLYDKQDILELYLNEIPYGAQAYGVEAAAKTYFDKDAKDLTADEAALLAALPRAPTYYSPYGQHIDELLARRDLILDEMHNQGYLNDGDWQKAKKRNTYAKINKLPNLYANIIAPHFVLYAQDYLTQKYGEKLVTEGGLKVITTLNYNLQKKAEAAVKNGMPGVLAGGGNNAAFTAGDPSTGQVLAMVGSRSFSYPGYGSYNAALARRQPGSSFKPYVYATGFKTGNWGPGSILYDVSTDFGGGYRPHNYDGRSHGVLTIRRALANSYNIPAVKMLYIVGVDKALETAHSLGITTLEHPEDYGLSLVLGAGEVRLADHVNGYEGFANGGIHYPATPILKATTPKGEVLEDNEHPQGKRVLDPQVAYLITSILSDNNARSTTFGLLQNFMTVPGKTTFVKTGTTDNNRDGWMMGGNRQIVAGVWVGNSDNRVMYGSSTTMTGTIWTTFMRSALAGKPSVPFVKPDGIKAVALDNFTGKLPSAGSHNVHSDVFPSWYKAPVSSGTQHATIDTVSGKLATDCTPEAARKEISGVGIQAEIPATDPAFPRWNPPVQALAKSLGVGSGGAIPTQSDDVHKCSDEPPTAGPMTVTTTGGPPADTFKVKVAVAAGTHPLSKLVITANNKVIFSDSISHDGNYSVSYKPDSAGHYTFKATVTDKALYSNSVTSDATLAFGGNGNDHGGGCGWRCQLLGGFIPNWDATWLWRSFLVI